MKVDRRGLLHAISVGVALAPVLSLNSAFASESDSSGQEASPGAKFVQMDPNVSFDKQIANNVAPVVLLGTFLVKHEHVEEFLAGFRKQFAIMRKQPGLISAQLHRGIAGSCLFMNYVIWESTDSFKHGFESPEFQSQLKQYPQGTEVSVLCFSGWRCQECVWVSRSHLFRFCRWSVRIWRKHGETQRLPVACEMTRECFRRNLECFDQGVVTMNPTYPYIDPGTGGEITGMIAAADKSLSLHDNYTKIVAGHGSLGNKANLTRSRDMLITSRDRVQKLTFRTAV